MSKTLTRKNIRLKEYDYSQEGYYFITICIKDRLELLGKIDVRVTGSRGQSHLQVDTNKLTEIILSKEGQVVQKHIENCNEKIENVRIDEYIIMPNHIHFIIEIIKRVAQECDPYSGSNN